jgi:hypothetical protein
MSVYYNNLYYGKLCPAPANGGRRIMAYLRLMLASLVVVGWSRNLFFFLLSKVLILLLIIINSLPKKIKKIVARPNKNQCHKQNYNSLSNGTHDSDMPLNLKLSILGSLELLENLLCLGYFVLLVNFCNKL